MVEVVLALTVMLQLMQPLEQPILAEAEAEVAVITQELQRVQAVLES